MRGKKAAVGAVALALAGGGVAAADITTYDASTQPDLAAAAVNKYCQPPAPGQASPCSMPGATSTVALGPPRSLSDKIINCNEEPAPNLGAKALDAEATTEIEDVRGEATQLETKVSADAKAGILKTTLDVTAKQFTEITEGRKVTVDVPVSPGEEGWAFSLWPTVTWSGTLTDNQNIKVTNWTLTYPGYGNSNSVIVPGAKSPMYAKDSDVAKTCDTLDPSFKVSPSLGAARGLAISVCVAGVRGCHKRSLDLSDASRFPSGHASVMLDRGSRVYASGTDRKGAITLHAARRLRPGDYSLVIDRAGLETMAACALH
jgi:hypothetical protein